MSDWYDEWKKEQKSGSQASAQDSATVAGGNWYDEWKAERNSNRIADFTSRYNAWAEQANALAQSSNERYFDETGAFKSAWRSDAKDWYASNENAFREVESQRQALLSGLNVMTGLPDDQRQTLKEALSSSLSGIAALAKQEAAFDSEHDYQAYILGTTGGDDAGAVATRRTAAAAIEARIAELDKLIAAEPTPDINYQGNAGDLFLYLGHAAAGTNKTESQKAYEAERDELQTALTKYGHGSKVWDDYYSEYHVDPNYAEDSQNRDFDHPSREELDKYDAATDSSTWHRDADGNYYDTFGTKIDLNHVDEKGRLMHPAAGLVEISDPLGFYLNATDEDIKEAVAIEGQAGTGGNTWATAVMNGEDGSWKQLEESEVGMYYHILNTYGRDAAVQFLSDMKTELNRRSEAQYNADLSKAYSEANYFVKMGLSAATIPAQAVSNVAGGVEDAIHLLSGKDINPYSAAHGGMNFSHTTRGLRAEELDNWAGGASIPLLDFGLGDTYQAIMSAGDMLTSLAVGSKGYGAVMGLGAFSSTAKDLYEQGASDFEIGSVSGIAGIAEGFFEKYSVDKLIKIGDTKTLGQFFKNMLLQGGFEASEEIATETANVMADAIIRQGTSNWAQLVEENGGNVLAALGAELQQIGKAGMAGFLTGTLTGGGASAVNYANYQALAKETGRATASAGQTSETYRLAQALAKKERDKSLSKLVQKTVANPTPRSIGRVRLEVEEALSAGRITAQEAMQILAATRQQNTAAGTGSGEVKYSIKQTRTMALTDQIAQVESNELNGSNSLHIGLSKTMTAAGFSDNPFVMNQSDYRKSRRQTGNNKNYSAHGVAREFFEQLDTHLNNSAMVIDNGQKATVITDYAMADAKGNPSYVIAGVLRNQQMYSDTVNQIKSVYPLDDIADKIQKAAEEGRLVITDKNKAEQMLSSIGIQTSQHNSILGLAKSSISQLADDVNTAKKGQHIANTALPQDAGYNGGDVLSTTSISDSGKNVNDKKRIGNAEVNSATHKAAGSELNSYSTTSISDSGENVNGKIKRDGASQNRPSVETGYDRGDAPPTTSISDPVGVVKSLGQKFGVDAQTVELMAEEYDGKTDPVAYAQAFATAYTFARYNLPMDGDSAQVVRQTLSDTSIRHATQLGRLAARVAAADAQKAVEARRAKLAKGGADTSGIDRANLTVRQRQSIGALDALGKALGVRFVMYDSQTPGKVSVTAATAGTRKHQIKADFYEQYDAWDGVDTNTTFTIGTTSDVLQSIGIKNQEIQLRSGTVLKKISKHEGITRDIFRQIPELLEHPIIVQFSDAIDPATGKPKYDSRITVLGELYAEMTVDGKKQKKPVLVSIELLPTNYAKTKVLDISIITSAYGHTKLQQYLNENSILYVEPNKKRTDAWLSLNRLQLPLGENQYGSIRSISDSAENVNKKFQRNDLANSNGFYTIGTNEIYVDVRAGLDARGTILFTASHELTHFIEDWSPAKYREFADFLMKELGKTNADVTAWVAHQKALLRRAGTKLTGQELDDAAFSEVVAQACESFLAQPTVLESIERLAKQNQSLYTKIRSWLKQLQTKLYKALGHYDRSMLESAEGRAVAKMTDTVAELVELWSAGLVDAAANAQAASVRAAETDTVTATEGTVKYQLQEYSQHQVENWRNSSRIVLYESDAQVDAFVTEAVENPNFTKKMYFGIVSTDLAAVIRSETGLELEGRNVTLRADNIRKILLNDHGNSQAEKAKKQRAVERGDFAKIPEIISEFDSVVRSENDYKGKPAIKFSKVIQDCKYTVIAVDSGGSLDLFIQTMYVGKKRGSIANVTNAEALIKTPETSVGIAPTKIISNSAENVKEKLSGRDTVGVRKNQIKADAGYQKKKSAKTLPMQNLGHTPVVRAGQTSISSISNSAGNVKAKLPATTGTVKYQLRENLGDQLKDWRDGNGRKNGSYNGQYFELGTTPDVFVKHGAPDAELIMYEDCVVKVTGGKGDLAHNIPLEELAKLPEQLNDPILLFSGSVPNSFVALTGLRDEQGHDVIVAVHINKRNGRTVVNKIASLYSKTSNSGKNRIVSYISEQIEKGLLLDASTKKAPMWFTSRGLQLPKLVQTIIDAKETSTRQTLHAAVSDDVVTNGDFSINSISNTAGNVKVKYSERDAIDKSFRQGDNDNRLYTEEQYNAFGWASYNGVLSAKERETLLSRFADFKHNRHQYPVTRWGEAVIHSTQTPDVIVYVRSMSKIRMPEITRIVRILAADIDDVTEIRKEIILYEQKRVLQSYEALEAIYGEGIFRTSKKRNFASFQEYRSREEGRDGKAVISNLGKQQDGSRGDIPSTQSRGNDGRVKLSDRDTAGRRLTAEQQAFFAESKVRDENGNLIVLYHGTENGGFTVFDAKRSDDGISFFFTDDIRVAGSYSGSAGRVTLPAARPPKLRWTEGNTKRGKHRAGLYEVYVNLKDPLVVECGNSPWMQIPFRDSETVDISHKVEGDEVVVTIAARSQPTRTVRFAHDGTLRAEAQKYLTERFNEHIGKEYAEMLAEDVDDGPSHLMGFGWNFVENVEQWYTTRDIAEIARQEGYDGVIFHGVYDNGHAVVEGMEATEAEDGGNVYVAFDQTAIKDVDNQTPTADKDIRYQRKGESTREILTRLLEAPYAYDTLVAKPDMKIVRLGETVPQSRKEVVAQAKKNAAAVGKANADGSVSVYVEDIGRDVILSAAGLRHGLDRRTEVNGPVTLQAGAILKNSIRINELRPERKNADGSYVLIGAASSASGQIYIVRSVVNIFSHEMVSMDVLYAISAKKEESAAPEAPRVSRPVTDSTISISEKSGNVNPDGQKEWNRSGDYPQDPPSNNGFLSDSINSISEKSGNVNPNAKKEEPAALNAPRVLSPVTDSTISISDLLEYVNRYFPDVLSEDVLRHFGRTERPAGELGQSALFQTKSPSPRNTLAAALETTAVDEQERQLIRDYLEQADELDAAERELIQVNERIRRMMFSAGERDDAFYEKLGELRKRAGRLKNQIEWGDMRLLSLRSTTPIADLRDRELADAVRRAKQAERAAYREQRESAQRTVLRDRISRRVRHISSMLLRGSKQRNVKPELTGLTVRTLESAAALFEENGENVGECLDALEHAYRDIGNLDPQQFPAAERARVQQSKELYDPEVAGLLADVRERVQDRPVSQLDMATLEAVNRAFTALHHTLTESNKVFRNGKAVDVDKSAGQVINELKGLNTSRKETELGALEWLEKQTWANENPVFAFDRIGSEELSGMFWDFIAGQDTYARDMQDAHDLGAHLRRKYGFNQWDEKTRTSFKLASGQTFSLNLQEMMSIYAYSLREQALAHMTEGGFVFSGEAFSQDKRTGKWMRHNTAVTYRLTEADIGRITAALTKEQKGYVQEMQAYLSQTMGAKGNEVSRVLYGIDLFTERHYFPLRSDRQFLASTLGTNGRQPSMVSLKNTGMTKEIVPGAGNPIVLQGFDEVWGQHVDKMSQYHGMVLPIENLQKVFNYNTYAADGQAISIRNSLNATHGEGAVTYLQQMLSDLNGGINQPGVKSPVLKAFAKFKKNAVGASLSTIVQQPTAIVRAMALIDPKYFAQKAEKQKAPLITSGDKIAAGMTDAERYEILKRKKLTVSPYNDERYQQILRDHPEVDGTTLSKADAVRTFKKIATEFSVYGTYNNPDIELEFEYGSNRMGESIAKNSSNYNQFAKLLSCFSEVVENAVGIEVHNRNTEGYKPDRTLKNVYVLASAFEDGDQIVPVKLEVKEFADKPNKLYLAVALEGIKKDRVISMGVLQSESHVRTSPVSDRVLDLGVLQSESHVQTSPVTISILDLLQNVNSKDVSLLKYVPGYKKSTETQAAGIKIDSKTALRGFGAMDSISDSAAKVKTYEEIKRYAPIAIIKEMGGFDTGTSAGATAWLTAREYDTLGQKAGAVFTDEYYRDELWMKGAQKADELGWSMIWNAVKAEVADKRGRPASVAQAIEAHEEVIDLSEDNELSKEVEGVFGSAKYKIIQRYILRLLGNQPVTMSDGVQAVVDKSDALHIANAAADKKTAQIAEIKNILSRAVPFAEDMQVEHAKFDYFRYYRVKVRYGEEVFDCYVNVGRGKSDGQYHLYDITKKIRDTADRINGLERPKPNEGYAQRNGISMDSISDSDGNVKFEQQKNADDGYLEIGSEAFYQACGKRFTEVIVRSQVYDSTLSRSGFMRSPSEFNKLATSFMGEGTMSINMMISTVRRALRTHSKADILKAVRTAGCVYAGAILANFAKTFVYAAIDWEDDESLLEKWMQEFAGSWPDLLPTAMLPYVRDVQSMIMGYDLERQEMSVIADMLSGVKTLFSTDYSDPEEVWKAAEDGLGYIAGGGGWPLRNLLRSTRAMVNMVTAAMDTVVPTDMGGALLSGLSFRERAKSERLYTALRQGNQQQIEALRKDYDSDAAFRSATVSALRQYDGRIRQAAARAVQGDFDALSHTADEIYCEQEFDEDIINSALQAEYNALQKALRKAAGYKAAGDTSKYADVVEDIRDDYAGILTQDEVRHLAAAAEPAETTGTDASSVSGGSIYTMTMVNAALESGDSGQAVNMIDELYRLKQTKYREAGASRREAEKAARSDVRASLNSYWKKRYIAACNSKDRAEQIRIRELLEATGMYTAAGGYQGLSTLLLAWRREAGEER